ncbi:hypothetical protein BDV34DRAFT_107896 [Aspergillus parasiticus]|uniref:Uncharacterized protein n=1 Tax=Aspergillus parasiticus TaxID=5067 RepID=A0A5N6E3A4_ASPPA|nr:hypothetical protein BDV34DRAFT_107896 [Aspergillus parasiticus]
MFIEGWCFEGRFFVGLAFLKSGGRYVKEPWGLFAMVGFCGYHMCVMGRQQGLLDSHISSHNNYPCFHWLCIPHLPWHMAPARRFKAAWSGLLAQQHYTRPEEARHARQTATCQSDSYSIAGRGAYYGIHSQYSTKMLSLRCAWARGGTTD